MNLGHVLFSPNGRIGQQDYWIAILIIIGGNIVSSFVPVLGVILWLGLIWVGIAVYGKRLHDAGKSAWLHVIPWALSIVFTIVGAVMIIGGAISAGLMSQGDELTQEQIIALVSGGGGGLAVMGLASLVWLAYTIWVGVMKSEPHANAHGPATAATPAPASPVATGSVDAPSTSDDAPPASDDAPTTPGDPPRS